MLRNVNVDLDGFMKVIDKCEGSVFMITEDGNKLNLRSKLSQIIGVVKLIKDGRVKIETLIFEKQSDEAKMFQFLLYGRV